jgi:two-component system NarL family response regulator
MADETIRVLIVDDNEDARQFLRRVLSVEDSIEVVGVADDGNIAVGYVVTEEPPHVVLMDLNMPHMDGITACSVIRTAAPATQVIMMSVQDDAKSIRDSIDAGAAAFLVKPIIPDELLDLIQRAYIAYVVISSTMT